MIELTESRNCAMYCFSVESILETRYPVNTCAQSDFGPWSHRKQSGVEDFGLCIACATFKIVSRVAFARQRVAESSN